MSCHHLLPVHGQTFTLQPPAGIPLCSHSNPVCQHLEVKGLMSSGSAHRFTARQVSRIKQQLALSDRAAFMFVTREPPTNTKEDNAALDHT